MKPPEPEPAPGPDPRDTPSAPQPQPLTPTNTNPAAHPINVWDYKPWWCQPWSIVATGFGAIGLSWLIFHRYWLTTIVALPLLAWMGFFVILYPRLVQSLDRESVPNPSDRPPYS